MQSTAQQPLVEVLDDSASFFEDLEDGVPMVAIVAPGAAAEFPDQYVELNTWLKSLGIDAVIAEEASSSDTLRRFEKVAELTATVREQEMVIKNAID